ncbi:MAG TPA: ABC-F family ATP-binding cassette domain-containing protein, partial [Terriglobales bacterium]|nr:ABC-F family ATP-binding cassette domain-containing protein [Terriglobales bacterium]
YDDPRHDELMALYGDLRADFDARASYDTEAQAERVLAGLGFKIADLTRDCSEFSGGWQMRIALATLLLRKPQLLLLDEPTNHLDLEARTWLEEFLAAYPYTVVLVAHDRYFLDVVVDRICELSNAQLTEYACSYSRYLIEREERRGRQEQAYRNQQEEIERLETFISRFRYQASKAALVQSRIKQLDKIERIKPPEGFRSVHFRFPQPGRSGRIVLRLENVVKRYGEVTVYDGLDVAIERGRKVALIGPNGAGKSTLIRLLAGVEPPDRGERIVGHNVEVGYFAQDQSQVLDPQLTVLQEITRITPTELVPQVRSILGAFLFSGDAVAKPTRVLSGGERNRLALAKLLVQPANCLLLDEPTNHLDIHAKEVLLEALQDYSGTLVFVAHDRYILDHLPNEVIEVGAASAIRYIGNYEDYLRQKALYGGLPTSSPMMVDDEPAAPVAVVDKETQRREREAAKRREREQTRKQQRQKELESAISTKEADLGVLAAMINDPGFYKSAEQPQMVFSNYANLQRDIEKLYAELEKLEAEAQ